MTKAASIVHRPSRLRRAHFIITFGIIIGRWFHTVLVRRVTGSIKDGAAKFEIVDPKGPQVVSWSQQQMMQKHASEDIHVFIKRVLSQDE